MFNSALIISHCHKQRIIRLDTKIGDTITDYSNPIKDPLPGFKPR